MRTSLDSVPQLMKQHDLRINDSFTKNLLDRIGYSTDTLLDFKVFQYLEILGNKFGICVKGPNKLFHGVMDELQRIQRLMPDVPVR